MIEGIGQALGILSANILVIILLPALYPIIIKFANKFFPGDSAEESALGQEAKEI